ncbi:MAG: glycosyltransferase [Actinomycetes bacterium]
MTDLSIVMPIRDVEATLVEAVDAVLSQQWDGEWEVLLVDNRSTDRTLELARDYERRVPRVRVVLAHDRDGLAYARHAGIDAATAPRVLICDGDDVVVEGWLAAMAAALDEDRVVTGPCDPGPLNPAWLAASRGVYPPDRPLEWHGIFPIASGGNLGIHRDVFDEIGPFRDDFIGAEDHEFSLRLAAAGIHPGFAPDARLLYRMRAEPRALWRQGLGYGRNRPRLRREVVRAGFHPPGRFSGVKSWARLVTSLPALRTAPGRAQWCWIAGVRWGHVLGSLRDRTVFL